MLLPGVCTGTESPADVPALVGRMEDVYAGIHDLSATFTQVAWSAALGRRVAEKGTLVLERPGKMRWEYHEPERKLFVALGETTWFYVPADNQVIESPRAELREAGISALLLDGHPSLKERYEIAADPGTKELSPDPGQVLLRFTPRPEGGTAAFAYALVSVDAGDAIARKIAILDDAGNTTEYLFDTLQVNRGVAPEAFAWTPPAGAEIVKR